MSDIRKIDARGLTCPQPVLETKKALDEGLSDNLLVLVDNSVSKENVARFARNQGCTVDVRETSNGIFEIRVNRTDANEPERPVEPLLPCPVPTAQPANDKMLVYVGTNCMGSGDKTLGTKLMRGFLRTLIDVEPRPWRMVFINSGVHLTTIDEEATEAVAMLEQKGVEVLSCGTCLQHFGLVDKLKVGRDTNMFEVIESLQGAGKVISPD